MSDAYGAEPAPKASFRPVIPLAAVLVMTGAEPLPEAGEVRLHVHDVTGAKVAYLTPAVARQLASQLVNAAQVAEEPTLEVLTGPRLILPPD